MNYILEYYQAIRSGTVVVGKWIDLVFSYLVKGLEEKRFFFDAKKANRAIKFIETFCHHCEGRNDLLKLELWQKAIISSVFGIVDDDGCRRFREICIVMARKQGKSLLCAACAAYCAFADGEYGARIYCVAPKLDQSEIIYNAIWQTIEAEPELAQMIKKRKSDYYIAETNTSIKKIAFNAKKSDGFNPSLTICDEIASWQGDPGLKQYEVMKSALGARKQPLIISISTSGYQNDGIYDELFKRSTRMLLGDSREQRLLPFLFTIDDESKWNDINELRKSCPNLGVSVSVDYMLEEIAIAEGSLSKKSEFLTKYCNIKQNSSQAWLPSAAVRDAFGETLRLEDFRGCYCVGGIDLSRTTDLTACCAVIEKDGLLYVFSKFFLPSEKIDEATARDSLPYRAYIQRGLLQESGDNFVDYADCLKWFTDLVSKYKVYPLKIGYDRYNALQLTQALQQYGFHCDDVFQGENLTPVIRETEGMLKDRLFRFGDNDLMKSHLLDSALKVNADTERVKLVKLSRNCHIDGTAALLDAMTVRQKWWCEIGGRLKNAKMG